MFYYTVEEFQLLVIGSLHVKYKSSSFLLVRTTRNQYDEEQEKQEDHRNFVQKYTRTITASTTRSLPPSDNGRKNARN